MTEVPEDRLRDLERGEEEMESDLDHLGEHLETAHDRAEQQRQRIEPEGVSPDQAGTREAVGDYEGESEGAQQGEGPKDVIDDETAGDDGD